MNWYTIIIIGVFSIALIIFLVMRNQKDKTDLKDTLNDDYPKAKPEHIDIDIDRNT